MKRSIPQPALISHSIDIFPLKEAVRITDEPELEALSPHDIEPFAIVFIVTRGKDGNINENIV